MEVSQIDAEIERLTKLKEEAKRAEEERRKASEIEEAREILGRLVEDLRRLGEIGHVPPRILNALTDGGGKFNPGLYIKRPKRSGDPED